MAGKSARTKFAPHHSPESLGIQRLKSEELLTHLPQMACLFARQAFVSIHAHALDVLDAELTGLKHQGMKITLDLDGL